MENNFYEELDRNLILQYIAFKVVKIGDIANNRYLVVDKGDISLKTIKYFDLHKMELVTSNIVDFMKLAGDYVPKRTTDIINIDYANEERGD